MRLKTTPHTFNFRMSPEQYAELHRLAAEAGMPAQQLMELRLFGRIRDRLDPHAPRKHQDQQELPLSIESEETPLGKTA